jgi:hypothetical protein
VSELYSLCADRVENTVSSSSLLHNDTATAETLFTRPLHSNGFLYRSVMACLLCCNLATDNSFCLTCHNIYVRNDGCSYIAPGREFPL